MTTDWNANQQELARQQMANTQVAYGVMTEKDKEELSDNKGKVISYENPNALGALAAALAKAQGQMRAVGKSEEAKVTSPKGNYSYKYSTLADVWEMIRKPLSENGLAVLQPVVIAKEGFVVVTTLVVHTSGQALSCDVMMPVNNPNAQGYGSAITYARRYGLCSMLGVVSDEDDDGNAASAGPPPAAAPPVAVPKKTRTEQVKEKLAVTGPTVEFGTMKGRPISELTKDELSSVLSSGLANLKMGSMKEEPWVPKLQANLVLIQDQLTLLTEPTAEEIAEIRAKEAGQTKS